MESDHTFTFFKWTSIITLVTAHIILGYIIFLLYPREVLTINIQPYPSVSKEVKRGENLIYHTSRCKHYPILPKVSRVFIYENGQTINLSSDTANRSVGCFEEDMVVPTPPTMPVGCGYLEINSQFEVNVLQTVTYNTKTEKMCIIK